MKSILCYGDSNTYGLMPDSPDRYPRDVRWTGILQKKLGEDYYVIEEGLSGRTTLWDDPIEEHKNGKKYLLPCLDSHKPVDLVILMLGTNDLKTRFSLTPFENVFLEWCQCWWILRNLVSQRCTFATDGSFIKPCFFKHESSAVGAALYFVDKFIEEI